MAEIDAFTQLALEKRRTLFLLYGARWITGAPAVYVKQAYSLSEALEDLHTNEGIDHDDGPFLVSDAFLVEEEDDLPSVHVELAGVGEIVSRASEEED